MLLGDILEAQIVIGGIIRNANGAPHIDRLVAHAYPIINDKQGQYEPTMRNFE